MVVGCSLVACECLMKRALVAVVDSWAEDARLLHQHASITVSQTAGSPFRAVDLLTANP